jgi:DNA polymerase lambda
VVYFTGSDQFNRSIRLIALKNGLSLSDHGLSRVEKDEKGKQKIIPENIPCYTEHEVFDVIGIKYKTPEERDL